MRPPGAHPQGECVQSASDQWFDEAYYQRYYFDKKTSVVDTEHVNRLGAFVCSYLSYVRVPVRRVLDVGCGIGLWREAVQRHFPGASYHGVEFSEYLCGRFGWERGSVVDYAAHDPADRKSTRLNSSHSQISYAVFCLKKKKQQHLIIVQHPRRCTDLPQQ